MSERIEVTKIGYWVPISCCMSPDIECKHPPAPPLSRRRRLRWWMADRWDRRPRIHRGPCNHDDCSW